jgi:hypothetical protein
MIFDKIGAALSLKVINKNLLNAIKKTKKKVKALS